MGTCFGARIILKTSRVNNACNEGVVMDYEEFKAKLLKNPEIKREYEALAPKFNRIRERLQETITKPRPKIEPLPTINPDRTLTPERLCPSQRRRLPDDI